MQPMQIQGKGYNSPLPTPDGGKMRMLCFDIETRPALAYVWKMWDENVSVDQLLEPIEMLSWSAKWVGAPEIEFRSVYHDGKEEMVGRIWDLLDQADVVIHYNGKSFDVPHVQREFLHMGYDPPAPYKQIDLHKTCQRQFNFISNKLAYVSEYLNIGGKVKHDGFNLWKRCMANDAEAWEQMKEYNVQDTVLLEDLYKKLLPWIAGHPSLSAFKGEDVCSRCGSAHLQSRGYDYTRMGKYRRYQCQSCGAWMKSSKKISGTKIADVAL